MKKIFIIFILLFIVTGCGKGDTCVRWKTVTTGGKDCSKIDAGKNPNQWTYCKQFEEKETTIQECVEWK